MKINSINIAVIVLFLSSAFNTYSQTDHPLSVFVPLLDRTWMASGKWNDGNPFQQEITFEEALSGSIIKTTSDGYLDEEKTIWGHRNHGIRQWDQSDEIIKFWEYDVYGGVTTGTVTVDDKNFYYQYNYGEGESLVVTDYWQFVDRDTYSVTVGIYKDGSWSEKYLETNFIALPKFTGPRAEFDAILKKIKMFSETLIAGDHEKLSAFYTHQGKIMPNGTPIIQGREGIAAMWKSPEGVSTTAHHVKPREIVIHDNLAYDYGYYSGETTKESDEVVPWKGKYVIIWKKIDEEWLIEVDIWNRVEEK